jgi:hypothetical protein
MSGAVDYFSQKVRICPRRIDCQYPTGMIKKVVQQGRSDFNARSVRPVREHGKIATCLRVAASEEAGNAAGGFFQHSLSVEFLDGLPTYTKWLSIGTFENVLLPDDYSGLKFP